MCTSHLNHYKNRHYCGGSAQSISSGTLNNKRTHLEVKTKLGNKCASWEVTQHEKLIRVMNTQHPVGSGEMMCSITLCGLIQAAISQVTASSDTWEQEEEEKELSVDS